jgi:Putative MetA-pathway of phenol degradation
LAAAVAAANGMQERKMTHRTILSVSVLAILAATPALAHHPGGVGGIETSGPIATIPATTLEQGHGAISFFYEYIKLGGLSDAALVEAAGRHEHVHSIGTIQSPTIVGGLGLTNDLSVYISLPYVLRTDIREGHHEHVAGVAINSVDFRGDSAGIGDMTALGQWRFLNNRATGTEVALLFGAKVPTGRTNVRDDQGELFEAEFQPGSGGWDGLIGLAVTQHLGRWSLDGNVLYQAVGKGVQDTDLGDRFRYNAAVSFRAIGWTDPNDPLQAHAHVTPARGKAKAGHVHSHDHGPEPAPTPQFKLDLVLELNGEWHDKQVTAGVVDPNSGGNTVYLSPGIRATLGNVSGFASVGVPVINELNGLQSKPDFRLVTGIAASF